LEKDTRENIRHHVSDITNEEIAQLDNFVKAGRGTVYSTRDILQLPLYDIDIFDELNNNYQGKKIETGIIIPMY
jgi:hypothetical protein